MMRWKWIKVFLFTFLSVVLTNVVQAGGITTRDQGKDVINVNYSEKGLQIKSSKIPFSVNLSGYIQADAMKFAHDANILDSGTNLRRARLDLRGLFGNDWGYALSYDFAGSTAKKSLLNAYISYLGWNNIQIRLGQMLPQFTLSNYTNNTGINFLELPLPVNAMTPSYSQGIWFGINNNFLAFQGSVFGPGSGKDVTGRNPYGATARVFYSPIHTATRALHIGIADWVQKTDSNNIVSFSTVPEAKSHGADVLIKTGDIG